MAERLAGQALLQQQAAQAEAQLKVQAAQAEAQLKLQERQLLAWHQKELQAQHAADEAQAQRLIMNERCAHKAQAGVLASKASKGEAQLQKQVHAQAAEWAARLSACKAELQGQNEQLEEQNRSLKVCMQSLWEAG